MESFGKELKKHFKQIDLCLIIFALLATAYGILLIISATLNKNPMSYVKIQAVAACIGLIIFFILSFFDVDSIAALWKPIYVLNLLLIGSLIIFGTGGDQTGNRAWIRFGSIGIQPAELGKILFILSISGHTYSLREEIHTVKALLLLSAHALSVIAFIVIVSHDMGTSLVYAMIFLTVIFCAGVRLRWFALGAGLFAAATPFLWLFVFREDQKRRILSVFNPELDPLGTGYHAIQSKIALGSGQLTGRGLFQGTQTQYGYLPAKQTDFVFSVAGEEFGMIGCIVIMVLLTVIIARCLIVARRSTGTAASLVCIAVTAMIIFQTFENIGMCIGFMPVIGLPLPFFSYGGSSILTVFIAIGLINSAKMRSAPDWLVN